MDWENLTLLDVRRLVAALKRANANPDVIRAIIEREPVETMDHGRVTLGMLINLLNQLSGRTVLSSEDIQLLNRPDEPAIVQPTFAELVAACHFDKICEGFTESNFPLQEDDSVNPIFPFHFGVKIDARQVAWELTETRNLHPIGMRRALEWRAVSNVDDEIYVIAGEIKEDPYEVGTMIVPYFAYAEARLARHDSGSMLGAHCRFLVCGK